MFSQYTNGTSALILGALKFVLGHLTTFLYPGVYHNYAQGGKTCNKWRNKSLPMISHELAYYTDSVIESQTFD